MDLSPHVDDGDDRLPARIGHVMPFHHVHQEAHCKRNNIADYHSDGIKSGRKAESHKKATRHHTAITHAHETKTLSTMREQRDGNDKTDRDDDDDDDADSPPTWLSYAHHRFLRHVLDTNTPS